MNIVINILHIIVSVSIIAIVLLQSGRSAGISGGYRRGAETFFENTKVAQLMLLGKYTSVSSNFVPFTSIILTLLLK